MVLHLLHIQTPTPKMTSTDLHCDATEKQNKHLCSVVTVTIDFKYFLSTIILIHSTQSFTIDGKEL